MSKYTIPANLNPGYIECVVLENIYTHPMDGSKFPGVRGGGQSKAKIFEGKCEANVEFLEGWKGSSQKTIRWIRRYGYFLEQHNPRLFRAQKLVSLGQCSSVIYYLISLKLLLSQTIFGFPCMLELAPRSVLYLPFLILRETTCEKFPW